MLLYSKYKYKYYIYKGSITCNINYPDYIYVYFVYVLTIVISVVLTYMWGFSLSSSWVSSYLLCTQQDLSSYDFYFPQTCNYEPRIDQECASFSS